jgi:hypothetical protein
MRIAFVIATCALVAGCGVVLIPPYPHGPMLTPKGAEVALVDVGGEAPADCSDVGAVRGRGVDYDRGVARAGAEREIRNAAAALGATHVRIAAESVKPGTQECWVVDTRDAVTLRGRALRCR